MTDTFIKDGHPDALMLSFQYEEPSETEGGVTLDVQRISFTRMMTSNFSDHVVNKYDGVIRVEEMTEREIIFYFNNVAFTLSDGKYAINGYLSLSR